MKEEWSYVTTKDGWVKDVKKGEKKMDKTVTFKVEYTVQISEKAFEKLRDENGNYIREKLLSDSTFRNAKFFAKNLIGKVKDFDTEG